VVGLALYFFYGRRHSTIAEQLAQELKISGVGGRAGR
jgi:hypothetical protein